MNRSIKSRPAWVLPLLLTLMLCGCTANTTQTDESGLPPHLSVNLHLPNKLNIGIPQVFSVEVSKSNKPLEQAEAAEFVIWQEDKKESAVTLAADEQSPGLYSVSYVIDTEGVYYVQARMKFEDGQVMPTKRFAIGDHAIERLIQLESAQHSDAPAPAAGGHH
ncbi:FixH family protein [Paenibacillus sinopodophylli]|uniref:FixH family protein n=1 Tax=Paenibacillus sinopodophylli TaxID=1837342 RepID=UPI00110CF952|nr:FixH family protein [Paenibacillus sinopodophylli]